MKFADLPLSELVDKFNEGRSYDLPDEVVQIIGAFYDSQNIDFTNDVFDAVKDVWEYFDDWGEALDHYNIDLDLIKWEGKSISDGYGGKMKDWGELDDRDQQIFDYFDKNTVALVTKSDYLVVRKFESKYTVQFIETQYRNITVEARNIEEARHYAESYIGEGENDEKVIKEEFADENRDLYIGWEFENAFIVDSPDKKLEEWTKQNQIMYDRKY